MGLDTDLPGLVDEQAVATGLRCLVYRRETNPTLTIHGSIRAGTAFEPGEKLGIAELTSRLLMRGTKKLRPVTVAERLESVGATMSFRNTPDNIIFQARTTSPWTQRVLGMLADCLTSPALSAKDVEREKEELLTDIRLRDDDTARRGMRELHSMVYPPRHPYRRDRFGTPKTVKEVERGDVLEYFENVVLKAPVVVAFAGKLDRNRIVRWVEKTFGLREGRSDMDHGPSETRNVKPEHKEIVLPHKTQADIIMGAPAVSRTHPDYEPLNLLNIILGELGFMGRLGQRVRDKEGLAYSCTSFLNTGVAGGNWTAIAGVNPKNVEKARGLMREEIDKICREPVGKDEIEAGKQNQIGSALMELESTEGIARTAHNLSYLGLGLDYFAKRRKLYDSITEPDLQRIAETYIEPSKLSSVIVGPKIAVSKS